MSRKGASAPREGLRCRVYSELTKDTLRIDARSETERICDWIQQTVRGMRKRGVVVAFSGGIDSSVVGSLAVRALGAPNVYGLMMPEEDSSPDTDTLGRLIIDHLGVRYSYENITPILEGFGCYRRRDEAIRAIIPEYQSDWKHKIVLPPVTETDMYRVYSVVAQSPDGEQIKARLPLESYLQIVAATNFKQRTRKTLEYYYADRLNYAVAGTPNLLEYDQGFFVKLGDGAADLKPIAHLYKTQVYPAGRVSRRARTRSGGGSQRRTPIRCRSRRRSSTSRSRTIRWTSACTPRRTGSRRRRSRPCWDSRPNRLSGSIAISKASGASHTIYISSRSACRSNQVVAGLLCRGTTVDGANDAPTARSAVGGIR